MRLWSIHPKYLDRAGIVALWRESLLAKAVLKGETKGYTNHPQLKRFTSVSHPIDAINEYLIGIWEEANSRGYKFNKSKIDTPQNITCIPIPEGQIIFEFDHLLMKLAKRDEKKYEQLINIHAMELHHIFKKIDGGIAEWEKI